MEKIKIRKARRKARLYFLEWAGIFFAPLWEFDKFLQFAFLFFGIFVAKLGWRTMILEAQSLVLFLLGSTFIWSLILFAGWCVIGAIRNVHKKESEKGKWLENKFIYHEPFHVFIHEVTPKDNGKRFTFKCKDAEPESFVQFKIESENSGDNLIKIGLGTDKQEIVPFYYPTTKFGLKLGKNKKICLVTELLPETDNSIIRVLMLWWRIDEVKPKKSS